MTILNQNIVDAMKDTYKKLLVLDKELRAELSEAEARRGRAERSTAEPQVIMWKIKVYNKEINEIEASISRNVARMNEVDSLVKEVIHEDAIDLAQEKGIYETSKFRDAVIAEFEKDILDEQKWPPRLEDISNEKAARSQEER